MSADIVSHTRAQPVELGEREASRGRRLATAVALFVAAFAVRALPWRDVFDERVVVFGNDAWYHLRRIVYSVAHFPAALDYDAYLAFPHGAKAIWSPVFDWAIAALVRPFVADPRSAGVAGIERLAVWVPPLLGAGCVVAAWGLARRHFGPGAALAGALVLCVLSGHFWYSQIGFVDHHAAVALATTLLLWTGLDLVAPGAAVRGAGTAVRAGLAISACLAIWPGAMLHVAVLEAGLAVHWLSRPDADQASRAARRLCGAHALAALAIAPLALGRDWPQWSPASPVVLSDFQPWWLGSIALGCGLCALATPRLGRTRTRRIALAAAVAALLAAASLAAWPSLRAGVGEAWAWLAKTDAFQARVAESQPLLFLRGALDLSAATARLSLFLYALPVGVVVWWRAARRTPEAGPVALFLAWTLALLAATLLQRRFFNSFSVALALSIGVGLAAASRALTARLGGRARLARVMVAGIAGVGLAPSLATYRRPLANEWAAHRGAALGASPGQAAARVALETADWLRRSTPPTRGWLAPAYPPDYGVLAPWHLGHVIEYAGRRPTVVDNFGDDLGADAWAFAQQVYRAPGADAVDALRERRIRYVVVQRGEGFLGEPPLAEDALLRVLWQRDGARGSGPGAPALEQLRLVHESRSLGWQDADAPPLYKVFERVPGARVSGTAPPGAPVEAWLDLRTPRRTLSWHSATRAGPDGRYRLRLPYATDAPSGDVEVASAYRLRCGGGEHALALSEVAVRTGAELAGPRCTAPASGVGR